MEVIYRLCFHTKSPYAPVQFKTTIMQVTGRVLWLKPEGKAGRRSPSLKVLSLKHTNYYLNDHNYPSQQKHPEKSQQSPLVNSSTSKGFKGPWVFGVLSCTDSLVPVNVV